MAKPRAGRLGSGRPTGLSAPAGEPAKDERPAERQPGTQEHLGENPYQGAPSPYVEGAQQEQTPAQQQQSAQPTTQEGASGSGS